MKDILRGLQIEKPAYGGSCIGYHEGRIVFVNSSIPGETVDAEITLRKKDYFFADVKAVIEPSPDRIKPECPVYGSCGGCSYQHMSYRAELELKTDIIMNSLKRISGIDADSIPQIDIHSAERAGYRSHGRFTFSAGKAGFRIKSSNEIVALPPEGCMLMHPEINKALSGLSTAAPEFRAAVNKNGTVTTSMDERKLISEEAAGFRYERSIDNFFQANRFLRGKMIELVLDYIPPDAGGEFIDVACGTGFFTIPLSGIFSGGTGIDIDRKNIESAKKNAMLNSAENIAFISGDAAGLSASKGRYSAVVVDPPRTGLDRKTRAAVTRCAPETIVYVSCNPATFSRDAADFIAAGYAIEKMSFVDAFPFTYHIETVSKLVKAHSNGPA